MKICIAVVGMKRQERTETMQSIVRDYWSVWKQFVLHGVTQEDVLPPALMQSWRRSAARGLDPYGETGPENNPHSTSITVSQRLLSLVRPAMEDLHQFAEGSECLVGFADAEARIVDMVGDQDIQVALERLGVSIGESWSDERQGSNALALALQESFPIQLEGAMHYRAALHPLYTSAAPVHDLLGQAVGVLGVFGGHEHSNPQTLGMITAAAQPVST